METSRHTEGSLLAGLRPERLESCYTSKQRQLLMFLPQFLQ